ncbi:MAG TPA: hypothetical protein PK880_13600, partial [Candidatus Competibacter sp.]|nr:hypothetical protein [Candidatus Competibacter sp.]
KLSTELSTGLAELSTEMAELSTELSTGYFCYYNGLAHLGCSTGCYLRLLQFQDNHFTVFLNRGFIIKRAKTAGGKVIPLIHRTYPQAIF